MPSKTDASFDALRHISNVLSFDITPKNLEKPSTCLDYLGILVDTENFTFSIPPNEANPSSM